MVLFTASTKIEQRIPETSLRKVYHQKKCFTSHNKVFCNHQGDVCFLPRIKNISLIIFFLNFFLFTIQTLTLLRAVFK